MIREMLVALAICVVAAAAMAQPAPRVETGAEVLTRAPGDVPHQILSKAQRDAMRRRFDAAAARARGAIDNAPPSPPGRPLVRDPDTVPLERPAQANPGGPALPPRGGVDDGRQGAAAPVVPAPGDFALGRSVANPNLAGNTIVVEPAVSNMSLSVFYLSNDRADYSADGGVNFATLAIPGGPPDAPNFCCDQTIVYDPSRSIWLWSRLYLNLGGSNSVAQISVIKNPPALACTYTYDPGGAANDIKVDYPQLGLSDNNAYLATSEFQSGWLRARMLRFDLEDLAACPATVSARVVGWLPSAKRMWTPIRGAQGTMYWGNLENTTQLRLWTWPETDQTATSVLKTVQTSTFANPDCRGGANNQDWIEAKGWGISEGFLRGALARGGAGSACPECGRLQFYWNSANDAAHPHAYVRSAVFDLPGLNLIAEPNVSSQNFCYGYADVHPNARGDLGVAIAFGGRTGGNGRALGSGVAIEDEYTTDFRLNTVYVTTDGTDMPSSANPSWDQRYGDYLSVKPHEPCSLWWIAGNYALAGGGGPANVLGKYVEFGRQRDRNCWERWNQGLPEVLP